MCSLLVHIYLVLKRRSPYTWGVWKVLSILNKKKNNKFLDIFIPLNVQNNYLYSLCTVSFFLVTYQMSFSTPIWVLIELRQQFRSLDFLHLNDHEDAVLYMKKVNNLKEQGQGNTVDAPLL